MADAPVIRIESRKRKVDTADVQVANAADRARSGPRRSSGLVPVPGAVPPSTAASSATSPRPRPVRRSPSGAGAASSGKAQDRSATSQADKRGRSAAAEPGTRTASVGSMVQTVVREPSGAAGLVLERTASALLATAQRVAGSQWEQTLATALAFLRRRITGEYETDEFGFDPHLSDHVFMAVLRPLYRTWFRVEVRGIDNVPAQGGALLVANHSGTIALDSLMTQLALLDEHPAHRHLRMLGADLVFATPFVSEIARKGGTTLACQADAERLLGAGEVVGVWPEGFKGIGKPFSERYKLQRFGRGGFVSAALRTGVPLVPVSIVGAEEIYPIIGQMSTLARLLGLPYAPITPTWPLLGPLGLVPLPSKWIIEFGEPVATAGYGGQAAEDPMLVFDLTDRLRETIQQTLYTLLLQRRSVFF